jgi:methyltransferase-like protein
VEVNRLVHVFQVLVEQIGVLLTPHPFGQFDYIICHGVYSWAPAAVQTKILEILAQNLDANGVGYVSYNTYPGWHARGMVREIMSFHAGQFTAPQTQIQEGRKLLDFLVQATGPSDSAYSRALKELAEWMRRQQDSYLFHEYLEDVNQPVYFHQFVERLAANNLRYLGEPLLSSSLAGYPPEIQRGWQQISHDPLRLEQYADFITNRSFRRSLVGHAQTLAARAPSAQYVSNLHITTLVRPVSKTVDVRSHAVEAFRGRESLSASTGDPAIKAALVGLMEVWPASLTFGELWDDVCKRLAGAPLAGATDAVARQRMAEHLLHCYQSNLVSFHVRKLQFARGPSSQPLSSRLARYQAVAGLPITNLRHRVAQVGEFDRAVLGCLDGRDRAAILDALERAIEANQLPIEPHVRSATVAQRRAIFDERLGISLTFLAQSALLVQ